MADRAIIQSTFYGSTYYLALPPEWVLERERAAEMPASQARAIVATHGGTVVLLDQRRTVVGALGRSNDRGPRQ